VYYASGVTSQKTNSATMVNIEGLVLTLPPADVYQVAALVMLCIPMSYAQGNNYPGANFCVSANGVEYGIGGYTYDEASPASTGRKLITIVVQIPLGPQPTIVYGQWSGVRGSTVIIDSFNSMTAISCGGQQP